MTDQRQSANQRALRAPTAEYQRRQKTGREQYWWRGRPAHEAKAAVETVKRCLDLLQVFFPVQPLPLTAPEQHFAATAQTD